MVFSAVAVLIFKSPENVVGEMSAAAESGLSFCVNLICIYAVWLGILEIANKTGICDWLSRVLSPVIKKVFKSENLEANKYIAVNLSANILGLGNVATPSGIKAMQSLDAGTGKPNFAMIMLLIVNTTSLSLLPTTTIGIRQACGSTNAASIILPCIITSVLTLVLGICLVYIFYSKKTKAGEK